MTTNPTIHTRRGLHPMLWIAASAVTIFALAGTAYVAGFLPRHEASPANAPAATPPAQVATAPKPADPMTQAPTQTEAPPQVAQAPHKPVAETTPAKPKSTVVSSKPHRNTDRATAGTTSTADNGQVFSSKPSAPAICRECGIVESNREIVKEGDGSGLGAVAGGVVGGALGHGVGQGTGRDLATIAGAIGGAVLGNKIEKNQRKSVSYQTTVRFEDGTSQVFNSNEPTPWQPGDKVRVTDGRITPR